MCAPLGTKRTLRKSRLLLRHPRINAHRQRQGERSRGRNSRCLRAFGPRAPVLRDPRQRRAGVGLHHATTRLLRQPHLRLRLVQRTRRVCVRRRHCGRELRAAAVRNPLPPRRGNEWGRRSSRHRGSRVCVRVRARHHPGEHPLRRRQHLCMDRHRRRVERRREPCGDPGRLGPGGKRIRVGDRNHSRRCVAHVRHLCGHLARAHGFVHVYGLRVSRHGDVLHKHLGRSDQLLLGLRRREHLSDGRSRPHLCGGGHVYRHFDGLQSELRCGGKALVRLRGHVHHDGGSGRASWSQHILRQHLV